MQAGFTIDFNLFIFFNLLDVSVKILENNCDINYK